MGLFDFCLPTTPPVAHHLHDDTDVVDGDATKGLQHGLPAQVELEPTKPKPSDPLEFWWRVPLSWVNNPFGVFALYQYQLDAQTHDQVIVY